MQESWSLFQETTPASNSSENPQQITITNPIHPLYGQTLSVVRVQQNPCPNLDSIREEESGKFVVVNLPHGETCALAIRDTSLREYAVSYGPLLRLQKLLKLAQLVTQLQKINKPYTSNSD